jgi:hypothetical protein
MSIKERLEKLAERLNMEGLYVDENIVRLALTEIVRLEGELKSMGDALDEATRTGSYA